MKGTAQIEKPNRGRVWGKIGEIGYFLYKNPGDIQKFLFSIVVLLCFDILILYELLDHTILSDTRYSLCQHQSTIILKKS